MNITRCEKSSERKNSSNGRWVYKVTWYNRQDSNLWPPPSQGGVLIQLNYGCIRIFHKCEILSASGHSIEIKSLLIDHRFRNVIFLLSLEEKSTLIDDTHIDETFYLLSREFLFRERLFILQVSDTPLIAHIRTELLIFIPSKNCHRLLFPFCETTSCGLFFYDRCFESVTICHEKNWSGGPGSNRHTQGLKP